MTKSSGTKRPTTHYLDAVNAPSFPLRSSKSVGVLIEVRVMKPREAPAFMSFLKSRNLFYMHRVLKKRGMLEI